MFRGVNVAHKYVNAEVGAAMPRFLAPAGRCSLFGQQKRSRFVASPRPIQGGTFTPNPKTVWRGDAGLRSGPKRQMKNPDDFGGDYDKIREELMTQGYRGWAGNLSISNTINWLSENTFGAGGTSLGRGIDAVAGAYRKFLDALPYRRQDGRQARALPKGRAAEAYKRWEAFKAGEAKPDDLSLIHI